MTRHALVSCGGDMYQGHVSGTKSQHMHTHENVAGTCFRDMLQRHVPWGTLILYSSATPLLG